VGDEFVVFGMLHLIALSIPLAFPFLFAPTAVTAVTAAAVLALGGVVDPERMDGPWLLWLGIRDEGRVMVDWYPVIPWFGLVLVGLVLGRLLYPSGLPRLALPDLSTRRPVPGLRWLGRHSLAIYLIHQPVLWGSLWILTQA
jgi:uncharacterized membrane protein